MNGKMTQRSPKRSRARGVQARNPRAFARSSKAAGALVCDDCGLVQHAGKWYRGAPPLAKLTAGSCPACKRIRDGYPAGIIRLAPAFLARREEILRLIRNVERAEMAEHPLERLMDVKESGGQLVVTTTGIHLARQIAHKIARRFHRKARLRYADQEDLVHVDWD
jgi:NMD protein affecting ribosome stability and mRNA decay